MRWANPTRYSEYKIRGYMETTTEGEGLEDLLDVSRLGINPANKINWRAWKVFCKWIKIAPKEKLSVAKVYQAINVEDETFVFDITGLHHCLNMFMFLGLLRRKGKKGDFVYLFEDIVIKRGLDWFRKGNNYLKGNFQEELGLFPLLGEK